MKNIEMRLLVIRTSAMGDVALTTPVLAGMRDQYPGVDLLLLTRREFKPLFSSIEGLRFFFPDFKKRHKGFFGLLNIFSDLRREGKIDHVIDLHDVLRSKILRLLFWLSGVPASVIIKGRNEKKSVIHGKVKIRLKHSVERYYDTFRKAGYPLIQEKGPWIVPTPEGLEKISGLISSKSELNIGVAPFAKHKLKMWPEENMVRLLQLISEKINSRVWLFGGDEESDKLKALQEKIPGSFITAGNLNLEEELALMSKLDLMIAMDSSNMHMAALCGIKVISIWGGTDPMCGFGAWMQPENYSVSIPNNELACRPCTIYGKGNCRRGDLACMNWLTTEKVIKKLNELNIW
jgi:ADP-heptose:LPS heptosyltransferase